MNLGHYSAFIDREWGCYKRVDGGPQKTPRDATAKSEAKDMDGERVREARVISHREDYTYIFGTVFCTLLGPIFRRPTSGHSRPRLFLVRLYIAICDALYEADDTQRDWDALTIAGTPI